MCESNEDNETELRMIQNKLVTIHLTFKFGKP